MAKTQAQLAQEIGLSRADIQEYKDTGSYGSDAQAKINTYKANPVQAPAVQPVTPAPIQTVGAKNSAINTATGSTTSGMKSPAVEAQNIKTPVMPVVPKIETTKPITNVAPTTNTEKTTTQTPDGTTTVTKETPTPTGITKDTSWENTDKTLGSLSQMIEARYPGAIAIENADGTITAEVNGEKLQWSIANGKPSAKSLGKVTDLQIAEQYKNPENIYNTLLTGGSVPEQYKNTPEYTQANKRFTEYSKYKDFNDKQFQTAFTQGLILPGTQLYNDLSKDPKIKLNIDKANALNKVNGVKVDSSTVYNTQSDEIANNTNVTVNGNTMTLSKAFEDGFIDQNEYNSMTNNSQVTSKAQEVEDLKNKADELQNTYDNVKTEVENSLKGTGATKSDLESIVGEKQKNMLGNLNLAISKYNNALGTLTDMKKQATDLFAMNLTQYNKQEDRAYTQALKVEDRAYEEQARTKKLEQAYQYQYGDLNSTNPTLQNIAVERAVADMYTKYPIPGMESQSAKVQKVKDRMAQGMSGTEAIASVENEIRSSQRYKDYLANEKAKITPASKLTEVNKDNVLVDEKGNVVYPGVGGATIDKTTATSKYGNTPAVRNFNPGNIMDTGFGGQKVAGERFTVFNSPQEGFNALVSKIENIQAGGSKVYSPNMTLLQYMSKYAPASDNNNPSAYANSIAKDLGITSNTKIKDINAVALARAHSKHEDRNSYQMLQDLGIITGHFTAGNTTQTGGTKTYTEGQLGVMAGIDTLTPTAEKALKESGLSATDWGSFRAGVLPASPAQSKEATTIISQISDMLKDDDALTDAVGTLKTPGFIAGTKRKDFEAKFNMLKDSLAMANLDKMKGAMSDKDIQFLRNTARALDLDMTEDGFKKALNQLQTKYTEILNRGKTQTSAPSSVKINIVPTSTDDEILQYLKSKQG